MKHLRWTFLLFSLSMANAVVAQLPVGFPLVSSNQDIGKPGVSMSVSGQTWAIGHSYDSAPHHWGGSPGTAPAGVVRVYDWSGTQFTLKGSPIDSVLVGQYNNHSHVLIDPQTLSVSKRSPNGIEVVVYDWDGSDWVERPDKVPNAAVWHMGHENTIAAALPSIPPFPPTTVIVSEWNGSVWTTKGNPINPGLQYGNFGSRLFMPHENMVAIAANGYDQRRGRVSVFYWAGFQWQQRGLSIEGNLPSDRFGSDLYMPDGNTIAIGSTGSDAGGTDRGSISVFDWNGQVWMPKGNPILGGTNTCDIGWGFQMPDDNTLVAVSDSSVQVYQYDGVDWQPVGNPLLSVNQQHSIWSSALSGTQLAVGCTGPDTGMVRVFDYSSVGLTQSENPSETVNLYPNPVASTLRVEWPNTHAQKAIISNSIGQVMWKGSIFPGVNEFDVSNWSNDSYFLRTASSSKVHAFIVH